MRQWGFGLFIIAMILVFRDVLLPFIFAFALAYLKAPVIHRLQPRLGRAASVILVYLSLFGIVAIFLVVFLPALVKDFARLRDTAPAALEYIDQTYVPQVTRWFEESFGTLTTAGPPAQQPPSELLARPGADGTWAISLENVQLSFDEAGNGRWKLHTPRNQTDAGLSDTLRKLVVSKGSEYTGQIAAFLNALVRGVTSFLTNFVITLMLAAFILINPARVMNFVRGLIPLHYRTIYEELTLLLVPGRATPAVHKVRAGRSNRAIELVFAGLGPQVPPVPAADLPVDAVGRFRVTLEASEQTGAFLSAPIPASLQGVNVFTTSRVVQGRLLHETHLGPFARRSEAEVALRARHQMACAMLLRGDDEAAKGVFLEALAAARATGARRVEALCLTNLGVAALRRGEHEAAALRFAQGEAAFEAIGDALLAAKLAVHRAHARLEAGAAGEALALLDEAARRARELRDAEMAAEATLLRARCLEALGRRAEARPLPSAKLTQHQKR